MCFAIILVIDDQNYVMGKFALVHKISCQNWRVSLIQTITQEKSQAFGINSIIKKVISEKFNLDIGIKKTKISCHSIQKSVPLRQNLYLYAYYSIYIRNKRHTWWKSR